MAGANTNIFSQTKTLNDFTQEDAQKWFQQQLLAAKVANASSGGSLPAPIQIADELQKTRAAAVVAQQTGDNAGLAAATQRLNDLTAVSHAYGQGVGQDVSGNMTVQNGYIPANNAIAGGKAGAEANAKNTSEATYKPLITRGDEDAKKAADRMAKLPVDRGLLATALQSNQEQMDRIDKLGVKTNPDGTFAVPAGLSNNFGMVGALPNRPGSQAANASVDLSQINANSFIQALGAMKAQSQTGASGLGALSEKEGDKVQAAAAALGKSQDAQNFAKNLAEYRRVLGESQERMKSNFNLIYPGAVGGDSANPVIDMYGDGLSGGSPTPQGNFGQTLTSPVARPNTRTTKSGISYTVN